MFPKNLKLIREYLGLTQTELGDIFDLNEDKVKNYEQGKSKPKDIFLIRLSSFLGFDKYLLVKKEVTLLSLEDSAGANNARGLIKNKLPNETIKSIISLSTLIEDIKKATGWTDVQQIEDSKSITKGLIKLALQGEKIDEAISILKLSYKEELNQEILRKNEFFKEEFKETIGNNRKQIAPSFQETRLLSKLSTELKSVPVYDLDFAAGFVNIINDKSTIPIAHLTIPEVQGCDFVIRAKGDSMEDVINDRDWIGIKEITDREVIAYSNIYAIQTTDLQLLKYITKNEKKGYITLKSKNEFYEDFELPLDKVIDLYIVRAVLPFSKIKTFI